jgi:hypothetical protein
MKNLILFTILSFLTVFTSCKKEEPLKPENNVVNVQEDAELIGFTWVLVDGRFYTENMDNGTKTYYDHFDGTQTLSVLDPISGADVPFDTIIQDVTTWSFGNTYFTLNGTNSYPYSGTELTPSVNGLENGSSRPMEVLELTDTKLTVKVHEGYGSDGTYNYHYFSTLTFVKQGESCTNCQPNVMYGYTYGGTISPTPSSNTLNGTQWVVTKFYDGFANNFPNDTLSFFPTYYTINGGTPKTYTLSSIFGNNMSELTLYGFTTIGGDYSGMVPSDFITTGQVNSANFEDIFNTNNDKLVWMTRIQ